MSETKRCKIKKEGGNSFKCKLAKFNGILIKSSTVEVQELGNH